MILLGSALVNTISLIVAFHLLHLSYSVLCSVASCSLVTSKSLTQVLRLGRRQVLLRFGKCARVQKVTACAETAAARSAERLNGISLHWKCRGTLYLSVHPS